jgi:TonB family protein
MNSRVVIGVGVRGLSLACSAQSSAPVVIQADRIVAGRLTHEEDPKYPKDARKKKIQGRVVLQVTVDEHGKVNRAAGISGDLSLVNAAEEAVLKWEFEPFTRNGQAVSVQQNLNFNFDLNRKAAELELPLPEPKHLSASVASPHLPIRLRESNAPPPGVLTGVFRVGGAVSAPRASYSPDPEYSDEARRAQYQGTCVLSLIVGADGLPQDIRVSSVARDGFG